MCRLGAAPTLPTSGSGTAQPGFIIAGGAVARVRLHAGATLHALLTAGTGTLYLNRMG